MRTYPLNSPQAAARIVALAMLADGHLSHAELKALEQPDAYEALGLEPAEMRALMQAFCEDLVNEARLNWSDACCIDERTLAKLLAEVDDPELRRKVINLCVSVVEADGRVTDGESIVLMAVVEHWGLHREMLLSDPRAPVAKTMSDLLLVAAVLIPTLFLSAWREYASGNTRDASLLGGVGAGGSVAAIAALIT